MDQRTTEWFQARCGRVTASRVADVIATTRTGWGASRANYMAELIVERLTGQPSQGFTSSAMQWGTDMEPIAHAAYAERIGHEVVETGFVVHPFIGMSGASPDGLVGDLGLVEIKCPNTATHIDTLISQTVPSKHITQMQWQLSCTGREWCDYVSYDPRLPEDMRLWIKRVDRCDDTISTLETEVAQFLRELDEKIEALRAAVSEYQQQKDAA